MTLRDRRKLVRLSQEQLAEKSGLSLLSIGRYERGERTPPLDNLAKLAPPLGCSVEELVNDYLDSKAVGE